MISEFKVKNFKKLQSEKFIFSRLGITLLAGDNNSGKSSLIQAIAVWRFFVQEFIRSFGRGALTKGAFPGTISFDSDALTPLPLPDVRYLWRDQRASSNIELSCRWFLIPGKPRTMRQLVFSIQKNDGGFLVRLKSSNLDIRDSIPRAALLPAFAGIRPKDQALLTDERDRLIGAGLAGAVLRNVLADMSEAHGAGLAELAGKARAEFLKTSPWQRLNDVLQQVFGLGLRVRRDEEKLLVDVQEVVIGYKGKVKRAPRTRPRDIMIEGSGFLQWLSVYALAVQPNLDVLLLDEPDAHLHSQLQGELVFRIRNLIEDKRQVILTTHSTEILGDADFASIYWLERDCHGYLQNDEHRRRLFIGLGGLYTPKIQQLKRFKRLLMLEGPSDLAVLRILSVKLKGSWPDNLVVWFFKQNDVSKSEFGRRSLFQELQLEIPGLNGLSLEDRDDKMHYKNVGADLSLGGKAKGGLALRIWKRRNLENYLLYPAAIARASGRSEQEVRDFLVNEHGYAVVGDFRSWDCHSSLALVDGKQILSNSASSVTQTFGVSIDEIAGAFEAKEIPADIVTIVEDIHSF